MKAGIEKGKAEKEDFKKRLLSARRRDKELQKLLKERNSFINLVPVAIMAVENEKIVEINKMVEDELGYSSEEMVGRLLIDFVDPDSRETMQAIHGGKKVSPDSAPNQYEVDLIAKDGSILRFDLRVHRVRRAGRPLLLARLENIHENRRKEKARIEAGKADALMTLAAGVAASLGSPLATVVEGVRSLRREIAAGGSPPEEGIEKIEDAASRMTKLHQALEQYCSTAQDESRVSLCDLREIVKDVIATLGPQKGTGIRIKTYLRAVAPVEAEPKEIQEMLRHLITNGIEAMPEGGDLYLSTEENAGNAYVYIQDSGVGIPDDLQNRIFDPFFTTKGGSRSGLGLSVSQRILRRHGGAVEITSRKEHGTTISIRMPVAEPKSKGEKRRVPRRRIQNARILVIEDDHMIRELLSHLLRSKGFKVLTAGSSGEGLNRLRKKAVDLVIVGSQTSAFEGPALAREIKRAHQEVPVALIIGHGAPEERQTLDADLIMTKPLDMSQVLSDVSRVLVSKHQAGPK